MSKKGLSLFGVCLFFGCFFCFEKVGLLPKKLFGRKTCAGPPTVATAVTGATAAVAATGPTAATVATAATAATAVTAATAATQYV